MRTSEDTPTDADNLIRLGTIASVDLMAARCIVSLEDGLESPPVRWFEGRMGETHTWSPPSDVEEVMLLSPAGEIGGGVVLGSLANSHFPAPANTALDLIRFADGAVLSYDPEAHAASLTLPGGGTLNITADVNVTGTLTATVDVVGGGKSLKGHKHGGVQAGSAQTGAPA